jgi:two-component system cell cycle sensor histidine kinase/response regulator CckA
MTTTTVLIVEDEKIIARGIDKQLRGLGYTVVGSLSTGQEAVQKTAALHPDLILMDIALGAGMDGVEAARQTTPPSSGRK